MNDPRQAITELRLSLPIPSNRLGGNGRGHWGKKYRASENEKRTAWLTVLEALQQSQLEEQNTAGEELAALQSIDAALLLREQSLESLIGKQTTAAREQIEALRAIVTEQRAQLTQAAEATKRLETQLEQLNDTSKKTYNLASLEAEKPLERAL